MCFRQKKTLPLYTIGENHHSNLIRSSFVIAVPHPFQPPLIRSIKMLLFEYPDIFGICSIKQKFLFWWKHTFLYSPYPFCAYFETYMLSLYKGRTQRAPTLNFGNELPPLLFIPMYLKLCYLNLSGCHHCCF